MRFKRGDVVIPIFDYFHQEWSVLKIETVYQTYYNCCTLGGEKLTWPLGTPMSFEDSEFKFATVADIARFRVKDV